MARPESFGSNDVFTALFGDELSDIDPAGHPSDEALQSYRARRAGSGRLDPETWLAQSEGESAANDWSRQAITAHLMTCRSCRGRYYELEVVPSSISLGQRLREWGRSLSGMLAPTPRPAMVAIVTQSVVILGLAAALITGSLGASQNAPSADVAETASASSQPQAEAESVSPSAPMDRAASADRGAAADASLPDPIEQRIQVLSTSGDPEARLVAARELQSWSDPSLVPELTRIYRQESHPRVQEALNRTINAIMSNMATQYDSAMRAIREFEGSSGLPASELMDQVQRQLSQFFGETDSIPAGGTSSDYSGALTCTASEALTLAQLRRLSQNLGGMMVVDSSSPENSFRMRLPFSAGMAERLRQLEDEMGLRCYQE